MTVSIKKADQTVRQSLSQGDSLILGLTSVVQIDGEDNWIKIEVQGTVRENESGEEARTRLTEFMLTEFEAHVAATVAKIRQMGD